MELTVSRETSASPSTVWAMLTDIERAPQMLSAVTAIERLDDGDEFGVGTRWRETREMFGREATEEMEVTALDEGHSYTVEARSRGTSYRSVLTVEPADAGSKITMTFSSEQVDGWLNRILAQTLGRLFVRATRSALQQDVDDIAAEADADADTDGASQ